MDNLIDCHNHSNNSFDADFSVKEMVEKAKQLKLHAFCITDHCDFHIPGENRNKQCFDGDMIKPIIKSVSEMNECIKENTDNINLLCGVEIGQATHNEAAAKDLLAKCDFDFVLGSLHNLEAEEDFFFMEYDKLDIDYILKRYFNEIIEMCEQNLFDSLAHLTYPLRYIIGEYNIKVNINDYKNKIDKILQIVINNGKALEVNTSGLRQKIGVMLPDTDIIKRYRELGGELITIGSDAHMPNNIANDVAVAYKKLKQCGFDNVTYFVKRKPVLLKI